MNPAGDNIEEKSRLKFLTNNFDGGMRRNVAPSKLSDNEYALLINGRSRYGTVKPIKLPLNLTDQMPAGLMQGIYGIDTILVVFKDGKLFARDYSQAISAFNFDHDFQMDQLADRIYAQPVPASWFNIQRIATDDNDNSKPVLFQSPTAGTPQCLVCQDGSSRPRLVFSVGNSRVAKDFNEWRNSEDEDTLLQEDSREYVPVGRQMIYYDNILYIVSPDGTEIYRSVTGRPLDFVVAIDSNGDKLSPLTSGKPEASRLSYAVDFNPITCIKDIATPMVNDGNNKPGFFAGTLKGSWIVYPDYTSPLFGEPTFGKYPVFPTGPLNQESITPLLGDNAIISESYITTFNSVQVLAAEGKNAPFYDEVYKLFEGVVQDITAAITSDNYGFLAVKTVYGYGILIYDTQREKFVSLDIYPEVSGAIKMFTEIKVAGVRRLFFITNSQLFEAFAGNTAVCSLYCREFEGDDTEMQMLPRRVRVTLRDIEEDGVLTLTTFVDGKRGDTQQQNITANIPAPVIPLALPFGTGAAKNTVNKTFTLDISDKGHTVGVFITMNFIADLVEIEPVTESEVRAVDDTEAGLIFAENKTL